MGYTERKKVKKKQTWILSSPSFQSDKSGNLHISQLNTRDMVLPLEFLTLAFEFGLFINSGVIEFHNRLVNLPSTRMN